MKSIEKETKITFNEKETTATIRTYSRKWKNRLNALCEAEPESYKLVEEEDKNGGATYFVDKKRLPLPHKKRTVSEEQKQAARDRLTAIREQKG